MLMTFKHCARMQGPCWFSVEVLHQCFPSYSFSKEVNVLSQKGILLILPEHDSVTT